MREIEEETGIKPDNIFNLTLRYIIVRRHRDTIRINYIYFGETDVSDITDTYEGTLHWIPEKELMNRTFTKTFDAMLRHYLSNPNENKVIVGVAGSHNNECRMSWAKVEDFELK